jgi:hypothetical protein
LSDNMLVRDADINKINYIFDFVKYNSKNNTNKLLKK